jgi:hypothetical protein
MEEGSSFGKGCQRANTISADQRKTMSPSNMAASLAVI